MPQARKYDSARERQAAYRQRVESRRQEEMESRGLPSMPPIPSMPGYRRWEVMRRQATRLLEQVTSEMETYYGERSEAWRDSETGEAFTEMTESVAEIISQLRELGPD
jgi:hypothetical protein